MAVYVYQAKAAAANGKISNAQAVLSSAKASIDGLIGRIPSHNGYDALGSNSINSLTSIEGSIGAVSSSLGGIKSSITAVAINKDRELELSEVNDGDTNEE